MSKVRSKHRSERAIAKQRVLDFLKTKCFICLDTPNAHPSKPLPCCGKYLHEGCLLGCVTSTMPLEC